MIRGYFRLEPGNKDAQEKISALIDAGVTSGNIFFETVGSEELNRLLRLLRRGDTLVVSRASDISGDKAELADLIEKLDRKGASLRALDAPWFDFNGGAGTKQVRETAVTVSRTVRIDDDRGAGRPKGPHREIMHKLDFAFRMYNTDNHLSVSEICKTVELNERTFYRHLERQGIQIIRRPKGRKPKNSDRY